jgi:hypothetical protein
MLLLRYSCANCIDETTCTCNDGKWECQTVALGCKEPCPPDIDNSACGNEGEVVPSGEFECCGSVAPIHECTC